MNSHRRPPCCSACSLLVPRPTHLASKSSRSLAEVSSLRPSSIPRASSTSYTSGAEPRRVRCSITIRAGSRSETALQQAPIRVNSEPGCAIAMGTVRGARVALGRGGMVHVAWNGTQKAKPANPIAGSPLLYARSSDGQEPGFEPQRNLMTRTHGLDGGASIAADGGQGECLRRLARGQSRGSAGEANRRMWLARSKDDGQTFSAEQPASIAPTGACACCGTAALVGSRGSVYLLYRAATRGGTERRTWSC